MGNMNCSSFKVDDAEGGGPKLDETAAKITGMVAKIIIALAMINLGVEIGLYVKSYNFAYQTYIPCGTIGFALMIACAVKSNKCCKSTRSIYGAAIALTVYNCMLFVCYLFSLILGHVLHTDFLTQKDRSSAATHHVVDPLLGVGVMACLAQIFLGSILIVVGKKLRCSGGNTKCAVLGS
ncbi:uncharacterized protein LOC141909867 [Tubulanus polymorphus]|uniref:uncharacterized protein LOC141909867 n=1 Tax=Tubulanus polymorphus TaxID=672921 RepID=UPI003DA303FE